MKYIDADLLRKRIEKNKYVIEPMFSKGDDSYYEGEDEGYNRILRIIDSLQQEQPQVADASKMEQEVDLENEIDAVWNPRFNLGWDEHSCLTMNRAGFESFARHFFELGLKARKEK